MPTRAAFPAAVLLLLCAAAAASAAFIDGLLPNGDFELGPKASDMRGTVVVGRYAVPKWEISGFVEYIKSGQKQGDMLLVVPGGAFAVRLGNEASIKQRLPVARGMYYSLTFSAARTCAQEEKLNVSVAPDWGVLPMQTLYSSNGWDSYAWAFRADRDVAEIVIHNPGVEEDPACGPLIDSVAIRALYPPKASNRDQRRDQRSLRKHGWMDTAGFGEMIAAEEKTSPLSLLTTKRQSDKAGHLPNAPDALQESSFLSPQHFFIHDPASGRSRIGSWLRLSFFSRLSF